MTAVYNHILPVWALETTGRLHRAAAVAHPVPWFPVIDVTGIETERTVIAMMSTTGWWADEAAAVPALKHLFRGLFIARLTALL